MPSTCSQHRQACRASQVRGEAARQLTVSAQQSGDFATAQRAATLALPDVERYGDDHDFAVLLDAMAMWFGLAGYRRLTGLVRRAATAQYPERNPATISLFANLAANLVPDDPVEASRRPPRRWNQRALSG